MAKSLQRGDDGILVLMTVLAAQHCCLQRSFDKSFPLANPPRQATDFISNMSANADSTNKFSVLFDLADFRSDCRRRICLVLIFIFSEKRVTTTPVPHRVHQFSSSHTFVKMTAKRLVTRVLEVTQRPCRIAPINLCMLVRLMTFADETSAEGLYRDGVRNICKSIENAIFAFSVENEASYMKVADDSSEGSTLIGLDKKNGLDNDGDELDDENNEAAGGFL